MEGVADDACGGGVKEIKNPSSSVLYLEHMHVLGGEG